MRSLDESYGENMPTRRTRAVTTSINNPAADPDVKFGATSAAYICSEEIYKKAAQLRLSGCHHITVIKQSLVILISQYCSFSFDELDSSKYSTEVVDPESIITVRTKSLDMIHPMSIVSAR